MTASAYPTVAAPPVRPWASRLAVPDQFQELQSGDVNLCLLDVYQIGLRRPCPMSKVISAKEPLRRIGDHHG